MPLDKFISEAMEILKSTPAAQEICVQNVKPPRLAAETGNYDAIFKRLNSH